jgi:Ni,Fe-hydrogenase III large subunit
MSFVSSMRGKKSAIESHRPWPRVVVDTATWEQAGAALAAGEAMLLGQWADDDVVHLCVAEAPTMLPVVVSLRTSGRRFPSIARLHSPASRLERAIVDLHGLVAEGAPDERPWLDHGRWGLRHPLGDRQEAPADGVSYPFLPAEGPPLHQIPVGPVHAGIIEPGHFRFSANGETVVRLEERLGYVHKGIEALMTGAPIARAAKLAGRISGDSTVAFSIGFARAVEAALEVEVSERAHLLRAVMAELERLANHLGDIGAICNDASFSLMHAHCGALREQVLRCSDACFGHRLMMDCVVPGGVAQDMRADGATALSGLIAEIRRQFTELVELYDNTTSLQDRTVTTGILKPELAARFAGGGFIGRASGRSCDARRWPGYAPYPMLEFDVPIRHEGDVDARVWIRIDEIRQSLAIIEQCLDLLSKGGAQPLASALHNGTGDREGLALVEGFRGDILVWLRIASSGTIARCHLRDPSWFQWPLLEAVIEGNIVADFPLCNKSFNCSYSGHDM